MLVVGSVFLFFLLLQNDSIETCYRAILRFETIQWSHAGEWLLLVRSPEGIADASVLLNVTRASGYSHAHFRSMAPTTFLLCLTLAIIQQQQQQQQQHLR
ncbi:hypothetical protein M0802_009161 [Mischocyttarus mexicanus]|nr:hypothetical protein M0802_009161 [Mischocyttarus mexicanus]